MRRASISEPSDTDYEPRTFSTPSGFFCTFLYHTNYLSSPIFSPTFSTCLFYYLFVMLVVHRIYCKFLLLFSLLGIVLAHQQEIERMSNFRDQLGEDWLRYQHHLDGDSTSSITTTVSTNQPTPHQKTLHNGLSTTVPCPSNSPGQQPSPPSLVAPEVLSPPFLTSEPRIETADVDGDLETESTLQWPGQSTPHTESTLDYSMVDGQMVNQGVVSSPSPSPESQAPTRQERTDTKEEEEEEDLGGRVFKIYEDLSQEPKFQQCSDASKTGFHYC